jgi:hypothetical protein
LCFGFCHNISFVEVACPSDSFQKVLRTSSIHNKVLHLYLHFPLCPFFIFLLSVNFLLCPCTHHFPF